MLILIGGMIYNYFALSCLITLLKNSIELAKKSMDFHVDGIYHKVIEITFMVIGIYL